jgi:hypothetical protein
VIADLALSEAELRERLVSLEADIRIYHDLSVAAIDALREVTLAHRWRAQELERERIENSRLREELLIRDMAA